MPVMYDGNDFVAVPDECPDCDQPLYDSGCDAPDCAGMGCQDCGYGCDLDFLPEADSLCAQALAAESEDDRDERIADERAAWGLSDPKEATR